MAVRALDGLPLVLLTAAAVIWVNHPVTVAAALFLGCKILTLLPARRAGLRGSAWAYVWLWPGMDPQEFFRRRVRTATAGEWWFASGKTLLGVALYLVGWQVLGLGFFLLFGVCHLSALVWGMRPIFRAPLLSKSPGELWGARWNLAFHQVAYAWVFRTLRRRIGIRWAAMAVFFVSGAAHELVLSVPAGGGYGLPTLYFLIQGAAVLSRVRGWWFTAFVSLAPLPLLFHGPFLELLP